MKKYNQSKRHLFIKILPQAVLVLGVSASVGGCAATQMAVKSYGENAQCSVALKPGAVLVNASNGKTLAGDKTFTIGLQPRDEAKAPSRYFNLDEHWLVRVSMGQKPTSGYGLTLVSESMPLSEGVGTLQLEWVQPGKGGMLPQVMTTPCVYLQIEKGEYSRIRIIDTQDKERFLVEVSHEN